MLLDWRNQSRSQVQHNDDTDRAAWSQVVASGGVTTTELVTHSVSCLAQPAASQKDHSLSKYKVILIK